MNQILTKIYLYAEDPYEGKYHFFINKQESTGLSILMIQNILFNTQMIWIIFIKILKNTTRIICDKYYLFLTI